MLHIILSEFMLLKEIARTSKVRNMTFMSKHLIIISCVRSFNLCTKSIRIMFDLCLLICFDWMYLVLSWSVNFCEVLSTRSFRYGKITSSWSQCMLYYADHLMTVSWTLSWFPCIESKYIIVLRRVCYF